MLKAILTIIFSLLTDLTKVLTKIYQSENQYKALLVYLAHYSMERA
jgi:hypothetical protein